MITEAGTDPHVAALVYIAAHAPGEGETETGNGKKFPNSTRPLVKTPAGFLFLDPANFPEDFAADLPRAQAEFMAHAQMPPPPKFFRRPSPTPPGSSAELVSAGQGGQDHQLRPGCRYAELAHSHKVEVEGASHAVYISHPKEVAALIEEAAPHALP